MDFRITDIFFIIGIIFIAIGIINMFNSKSFYQKIMASALIDTAGYLCMILGVIFRIGFNTLSIKMLVFIFTAIFINPLVSHFIIQSSWKSGNKEDVKD